METLPWYRSAIVRQQIVAFLVAAFGLLKFQTDIDVDATVGAILAGIAALIPVYTIVTRIFKPAPNLSQTAVAKEVELVMDGKIPPSPIAAPMKQGGFATLNMLILALVLAAGIGQLLLGCTHTQAAYKAAPLHGEALADTAFVITEHYAAVIHEAALMRKSGTLKTPLLEPIQRADQVANRLILGVPAAEGQPAVPGLEQLASTYTALHDATSEAQLQSAVNEAVVALGSLIRAVNTAKGQ